MKKNLIFKVIIISLLIIMSVSFVISGFITGKANGFATIGIMSFVYLMILITLKK